MLDRTGQRIVGVLLEKELAVPDAYPMTLNALLAGCNQKSNRDPEMALESFEVAGALMALQESGWVVKIEGGRAEHYRHEVDDKFGIDDRAKAVLAELLVRGPQAPGSLKSRVGRMGFHGSADEVAAVLGSLLEWPGKALVEQLEKRPRERDRRWRHTLGPAAVEPPVAVSSTEADAPAPRPIAPPVAAADGDLRQRGERLEAAVDELRQELRALRGARSLLGSTPARSFSRSPVSG